MAFIIALLYPFIIIILALLIGVFIASLILFINNMRSGCKNKWPGKNIAGAIISGVILSVAVVTIFILTFYSFDFFGTGADTGSSSRNAAIALLSVNI